MAAPWARALVEVDAVGDVEVGLEVQGAGEVHVVAVDGDVAGVDLRLPSSGSTAGSSASS